MRKLCIPAEKGSNWICQYSINSESISVLPELPRKLVSNFAWAIEGTGRAGAD